jgi:hypothetical protein
MGTAKSGLKGSLWDEKQLVYPEDIPEIKLDFTGIAGAAA